MLHTSKTSESVTINYKKSWGEAFSAYLDKRALIMLFLGFSAGIPILLIFSSLSLWLREAGIERSTVTMFSWAALGYSFKFIWAPLIDAIPLPVLTKRLGKRRAWLLTAQALIITAIVIMASINPVTQSLGLMAAGAVLLGFSSATQDIVIDAYRIELADTAMQTVLSATYNAGYRIGMIVAGAGALFLAEYFGSVKGAYVYEAWRNTYFIMAGVMLIGMLATLTTYETKAKILEPLKQAKNEKIMGLYASCVLIPSALLGFAYLLMKVVAVLANYFSYQLNITLAPIVVTILSYYFGFFLSLVPIAFIYLIFNQVKFSKDLQTVNAENSDYLRLVAVFVLSVVAFVLSFMGLSQILPETKAVFTGFLLEAVHLLGSLTVAVAVGTSLVKLGLVNKQVAIVTWVEPILDFFKRYGKKAFLLLMLIGLYRISDIVAGVISNVFYEDMGFSKSDIATAVKTFGVLMVIVGGFVGGIVAQKFRIMQAMMIGGVLACMTNLMFVWLAMRGHDVPLMYTAVAMDNLASGMAGAVFIAFLSALTNIRFTAVQYAIFSSLMTLIPKVLGGYSGTIVDNMGYAWFFTFTALIGLPILYLVYLVDKNVMLGEPVIDNEENKNP